MERRVTTYSNIRSFLYVFALISASINVYNLQAQQTPIECAQANNQLKPDPALVGPTTVTTVEPVRIVLVSGSNFQFSRAKGEFMDIAAERDLRKEWADRHGFDSLFVDARDKTWDMWDKAKYIREAWRMYPKAEWAWWFDSDGTIMEYEYNITKSLLSQEAFDNVAVTEEITSPFTKIKVKMEPRPYSTTQLIVTKDSGGFNCGSFFIRRGDISEAMMDVWLSDTLRHSVSGVRAPEEQAVLEHLIVTFPFVTQTTTWVKKQMINAYGFHGDYQKGKNYLVAHLPGCEGNCKQLFDDAVKIREEIKRETLEKRIKSVDGQ